MYQMLSRELARHMNEVRRAIANFKYERAPDGISLFGDKARIGGEYAFRHRKASEAWMPGPWSPWAHNLMPDEGLTYILNLIGANSSNSGLLWYIALHSATTTVLSSHDAAGYASAFTEITSGSEGYDEATRVQWVDATATTPTIHNDASPAQFTIDTASSLAVNGVAMLSASAKGATSGKLLSAYKFPATRTFSDTDLFDVKYHIGLATP